MASKYSTKVLLNVPKDRKAVMCLSEKMCVLNKLHSGKSYSAVGCEFIVSKSTMHIK